MEIMIVFTFGGNNINTDEITQNATAPLHRNEVSTHKLSLTVKYSYNHTYSHVALVNVDR